MRVDVDVDVDVDADVMVCDVSVCNVWRMSVRAA